MNESDDSCVNGSSPVVVELQQLVGVMDDDDDDVQRHPVVVDDDDDDESPHRNQSNTTTVPPSTVSISYWRLLVDYPLYRYFIASYIATQLGEWLTYVASLSILELAATTTTSTIESALSYRPEEESSPPQQHQQQQHYLISILVVCRLVPNTFSSFLGGILADTRDRKQIMFYLDLCGGFVAIIYYITAIQTLDKRHPNDNDNDRSVSFVSTTTVTILLLCTIAQSTISGLYQPSRSSIVPMLVGGSGGGDDEPTDRIEKANEIAAIIWSIMAAVGSSFGGFMVDHYGVAVCFATDTVMYFTSAIVLALFVKGHYNVKTPAKLAVKSSKSSSNLSLINNEITTRTTSITELDLEHKTTVSTESRSRKSSSTTHLTHSDSGRNSHHPHHPDESTSLSGLLHDVRHFLTSHDAAPYLLIKACGALLFGASDVINVTFAQHPDTGVLDPQRLGYLFSAIGIGCLLGPIVMPPGRCYLSACIGSYYVMALGYAGMAWCQNFWMKCFWTGVKASGSAVMWVDSTILIQTTTPATLLGRITSIDLAIALLGEAASAIFGGIGQDYGMSAEFISLVLSGMGLFWGVVWTMATIHHRYQRNRRKKRNHSSVELEPLNQSPY